MFHGISLFLVLYSGKPCKAGSLPVTITGKRDFPGFTIYDADNLPSTFSDACVTALTATIKCQDTVFQFVEPRYHGTLGNDTLTDLVCDQSCGDSLATWFSNAEANCDGAILLDHPATILGGNMWNGWNETCYKDLTTDQYCNGKIDEPNFSLGHY